MNAHAFCPGSQMRARSERSLVLKELNSVRHELSVDTLPPRSRSDPSRKPRGCSDPRPRSDTCPGIDLAGNQQRQQQPRQHHLLTVPVIHRPMKTRPVGDFHVHARSFLPPAAGPNHHHTRTTLTTSISPVENTRTLLVPIVSPV
ncbi:hypothetical protein MRX96_019799 [Rhipicephalus microplus]|uniref:uncharacterized protein LOC142796248 n=1 Tax=Rhipicephalus microplus TaxID=6941 RepID=UPI003F6BADD6